MEKKMTKSALRSVIDGEGITAADLSRESGVSAGTIGRYLKGETPRAPYKSKILKAINSLVKKEKYEIADIFPE